MPVKADDVLRKVTLNLYESDCQWLEKTYGHGWTERIRQHIHSEVSSRRVGYLPKQRLTLGDISE